MLYKILWIFLLYITNFFGIWTFILGECSRNTSCSVAYETWTSFQCQRKIKVTAVTNPLTMGEEPFWDPITSSLYFVDIEESMVHRYSPLDQQHYCAVVGNKTVGAIIPIKDQPGMFFINYGDEIALLIWDGYSKRTTLSILYKPDPNHPYPKYFLNDAKVSPNHGLVFNTDPNQSSQTELPFNQSTTFGIFNDENVKILLKNQQFANGLGWTKNGSYFFRSDSKLLLTYKSVFNQTSNTLGKTSVIVDYAKLGLPGHPDSLTTDTKDNVWLASNGGSEIVQVNPGNGEILCRIELPAAIITNVAFGRGKDPKRETLDVLYATSFSGADKPADGRLLSIEGTGSCGYAGEKVPLQIIDNLKNRSKQRKSCY